MLGCRPVGSRAKVWISFSDASSIATFAAAVPARPFNIAKSWHVAPVVKERRCEFSRRPRLGDNNYAAWPGRVLHKVVSTSDFSERDLFSNLEARPLSL